MRCTGGLAIAVFVSLFIGAMTFGPARAMAAENNAAGNDGVAPPECPRPEHPRPDMKRDSWQNLNGRWMFEFDEYDQGLADGWQDRGSLGGEITVPFPIESELSGIGDTDPPNVAWYMKTFDLGQDLEPMGGRLFLHFGAADYKARAWLNGVELGEHVGGYTPFSFDITDIAKPEGNKLVVRVRDSKDRNQVRGKQTTAKSSYSIVYTKITGIWQTVWIERRGRAYIDGYRFNPGAELDGGEFLVTLGGDTAGVRAELEISPFEGDGSDALQLEVLDNKALWKDPGAKAWSPEAPNLYRVVFVLRENGGLIVDKLESYVGVRTIETRAGRVYLNGEDFYQKLLLDQGYFPGGIYAPADDAIMRADCEMYKRMGFNGLRKHQKIEDPRFLYWCDRLGLVVWEEMPSTMGIGSAKVVEDWAMEQFAAEMREMVARDYNRPCIITWTVFNEDWGVLSLYTSKKTRQWFADMVNLARRLDSTRPVCDNSGGKHIDTDIWDFHHYLPTNKRALSLYRKYRFENGDYHGNLWWLGLVVTGHPVIHNFYPRVPYEGQPIILSEYGGFGYYPTAKDKGLLENYREYTLAIGDFPYIRGYCYTQPYDVEQEQNGLMTFERKPKVDPDEIRRINDSLNP